MAERFAWFKPSPLWQKNGRDLLDLSERDRFHQPHLLEFGTDDFMERFFTLAAATDSSAFPIAANPPLDAGKTLKLYQPAHGCFYLVCASLCCLAAGFPDRAVRLAQGESIFFLLRRHLNGQEYGWVIAGEKPGWQPVNGSANTVLPGEERLPLFNAPAGNGRSLVFGYVPVASRESYGTPPAELPGPAPENDPRIEELEARFISQLEWINALDASTSSEEARAALLLSVFLLLDLWEFLYEHLPEVALAIRDETTGELTGQAAALVGTLQSQPPGAPVSLATALADVAQARDALNEATNDELPPPFENTDLDGDYLYSLHDQWNDPASELAPLVDQVAAALAEADAAEEAPPPVVEVPKVRYDTGERYVLRCVYERPQCAVPQQWVSQPSVEFELASFFDPDAPVRPLRIALPEMNLSALRRAGKGVAFIMPDSLQTKVGAIAVQVNHLTNGQSLEQLGMGYLCALSIPIITICAFILLLVLVIVLHLVFWWIPFFKICLPVPKPE